MLKPNNPNFLALNLAVQQSAGNPEIERYESMSARGSNRTLTIIQGLRYNVLKECSSSPLGTCLVAELSRLIDVLQLYKPIADFQIE